MFSLKAAALLFVSAAFASGDTIAFQGAPTGVNDGVDYVLPYQLTINGTPQLVDCFDILDSVQVGDTWNASLLTADQAAVSGFFSGSDQMAKYERIAWLSSQSYGPSDQQIGLQYAIWNVFGTAPQTTAAVAYENAADSAASSGYTEFDFSSYRFIEQMGAVSGTPGTEQAFVYSDPSLATGAITGSLGAPEPATIAMLGGGLLLLALAARKR